VQNRLNEHERKKNNKIALELCHPEAAAYAECIKGRTFSMVIYCREIFNELNGCLKLQCVRRCHRSSHPPWLTSSRPRATGGPGKRLHDGHPRSASAATAARLWWVAAEQRNSTGAVHIGCGCGVGWRL
jgi:hypothetical protein